VKYCEVVAKPTRHHHLINTYVRQSETASST